MSTSPALVLLPLVLVLALWGIGALAAWCAGARRAATLVAAGLPVTVGVMAVLGVAEIFVPFPFGWLSLAAGTLVLAVVGRVVSARRKRGQREAPAEHAESQWREAAAMAGSLVATVMVASAVVFIAAGGTWETVSQTWDAMFDANAIRQAYLSGSIDPRTLVDFAFPHPVGSFYPATFHAIGTLAMHVLGCDAVVASNLAAVVVAGGLWPSCLVLAVRFLRGPRLSYSVLAAILTLGFWGMPWSPLGWGVLWATATAVAFAPLPIVGFATLLGLGPIARSRPSSLAMLLGEKRSWPSPTPAWP